MTRWGTIGGIVVSAIAVLCATRPTEAQFETPNRSFHDSSAFRLEGRHATLPCASCHLNGQYQGTPTTCYECHWVRRKDDRYQTRLGTQCEQCHRPVSWTAVRWDHGTTTGVVLNAAHRTLGCVTCHQGGNFSAATVVCVSCHQQDFNATRSPNHAAAGFPLSCEACHRPADSTWRTGAGGEFNHNAIFPLQGVHATVSCASCHRNNVYTGTSRDCVGCHQADYNRAQSPNHAAASFPTTCDSCHRPTDPQWKGASFNHNSVFALVGVHATQACAACHQNNVYKGTARTCVGCHQAQYNGTQTPNHAAAGFPTTCESCHRATDTSWTQGQFSHTWFPLSGPHNRPCAQCHTTPNVFTQFNCTTCHARGETDGHHRGINGYRYDSAACYSCHPNGRH
jgi:hypothetical protein